MTIPPGRLHLHEEILLLALDDDKGTAGCGSMAYYGFGGAVLTELLVHGRVRLDKVGKKSQLAVTSPRPIGDPCLDRCLEKVRAAKRPATAKTPVARFANAKDVRKAALGRLCERGVLRAEQRKILGIFPRTVFPEVDPGLERELRARVSTAIEDHRAEVDDRTAMLIAIAAPAGLLKSAFGKALVKRHKARIDQIAHDHPAGEATRAAIQAMQAAVIAATTAAAAASATG